VPCAPIITSRLEAECDAVTERVFTDKLSGVRDDRPGLAALIDYVRAGDTVVVVALDRLGSYLHEQGLIMGVTTDQLDVPLLPRITPAGRDALDDA